MGRYVAVGLAIIFLLMEPFRVCLCGNSTMGCMEWERQALLKLKASLIDPNNQLSSWKGTDCCQWRGIGCNNITKHIVKLDLRNPCYPSETYIPSGCDEMSSFEKLMVESQGVDPSLLQLEYLNYLDLAGNNFHGSPIPVFLASMERLTHLSLAHSNFSGRIPQNLGNLTNLRLLDLSSNPLYMDNINWVSQLSSLQHLDMSYVSLVKAQNLFQVLNMLPLLLRIYLTNCELNNLNFPRHPINVTNLARVQVLEIANNALRDENLDAFQNMTSVQMLDLSYNNLDILPLWLNKFNNLVELDMSYNALHGSIPDALRNMTSITVLDLSDNLLSVPSWLGELSLLNLILAWNKFTSISQGFISSILKTNCDLIELDLSGNNLQGEAFGGYENVSRCIRYNLEILDLSYNEFSDHLPSWLGQYDNLSWLFLSSNSFIGPIPSSLGNLSNLSILMLDHNHLNGTVPDSFRQLVNLRGLNLDGNNLEGVFPDFLGQLVTLNDLSLSNNNLHGVIPDSIGQFVSLNSLSLSENNFHGVLTDNIGQLVKLKSLYLSNNNFSGIIPQSVGKLLNLRELDLSTNNLHGKIPDSFGALVNLFDLDLSSNALEGSISEIITWSPYLNYLNLSNNHFTGALPGNISDIMPNLSGLFLENNLIIGSIPDSLCKIETLNSLDLSKNKLSGEIPDCWRDTQGMWDKINLSSNKLSGVIPSSFGNLASLMSLHLNDNNLQGELPLSLKHLKKLLILDLGENQLSGNIPSWTGDSFPFLQILRLHQNMFNGIIPSQLCKLSTLKILDLANNNLVCSVPGCIYNIRGMISVKSPSDANMAPSPFDSPPGKSVVEAVIAASPEDATWGREDVKQVMKGLERDYTNNLKLLVNLDLSNNNLTGLIPEGIIVLTGLQGLNLSYNHLSGEIPKWIGEMKSLESIDLSHNRLSGRIPSSMSSLTWLSHLNLSYNNFSGPIPRGNQFLSLDDPSIYTSNPYLCGDPLKNKCPGDESHRTLESTDHEDEDGKDDSEKMWFYFVIAIGFTTGFWGVIGVLVFKKSWRHALFSYVDKAVDEIYVSVALKVAKLRKSME